MSRPIALGAVILIGLLAADGARAACAASVTASELASTISAADGAFSAMDEQAFHGYRGQALQNMPCLGEPITPNQAATLHRVEALAAFLERDRAGTVASFRSLLAVSPGYLLSEDLAPDDHPLRIDFEAAEGTVDLPGRVLPSPRGYSFLVDGRAATVAPVDRPFLLQMLDAEGKVVDSALVAAGGELPDFAGLARSGADRGDRATRPLTVGAIGAAVVAGGLYIAADGKAQQFWDPATPDSELEALRRQTNTLAGLSVGAGVVAVGTGAAALVTWRW